MKINKKGLTILEIIIIIALIGAAIPTILIAFSQTVGRSASAQATTIAAGLAEEKMEEIIKGKRFADVQPTGPTQFTSPFDQYSYETIVNYVNAEDLNISVTGPTDFKKVEVVITKSGMTGFNIKLTSLLTYLGY